MRKAGRIPRDWMLQEIPDSNAVDAALDTLIAFRAAHQYALIKANNGLRSVVRTSGCPVEVSQRLKRMNTILDKLIREPTMQLPNMQDIGGCRAVLGSISGVRKVEQRLKKNRQPVRVYDYITHPRPSGYRGVHVIVTYEDERRTNRFIEVQLRTKTMHEWAIAVEQLSGRLGNDLKGSRGPAEVLTFLAAISRAMAIEEHGGVVAADLLEEMTKLRVAALPYMGGPTQ